MLVVLAGAHVTLNSFILLHIHTTVDAIRVNSQQDVTQNKINQQILSNTAKELDTTSKLLNDRTPVILGTANKVDKLESEIHQLESEIHQLQEMKK